MVANRATVLVASWGRGSGGRGILQTDPFPTRGYFHQHCKWMCLPDLENWTYSIHTNFSHNYSPFSIPFLEKKIAQIGCFSPLLHLCQMGQMQHYLLKRHVIWDSLVKNFIGLVKTPPIHHRIIDESMFSNYGVLNAHEHHILKALIHSYPPGLNQK